MQIPLFISHRVPHSARHLYLQLTTTPKSNTVAVCGLPTPEEKHAVIMCRFAHYCIVQMDRICSQLENSLGDGTKDLRLRVGLHSGPTTAGVLRGEKARFQLFGDTVNTAARMESTSKPGFIQVSQKTADYLVAKGKQQWLRPRSDLVNAKGKGVLQTYFVDPGTRPESVHTWNHHTSTDVTDDKDDAQLEE